VEVSYPTPLPGIRAVQEGRFTAVSGVDSSSRPARTLDSSENPARPRRRWVLAILDLSPRARYPHRRQAVAGCGARGEARSSPENTGRVPGSDIVPVAAAHGRGDRRRRTPRYTSRRSPLPSAGSASSRRCSTWASRKTARRTKLLPRYPHEFSEASGSASDRARADREPEVLVLDEPRARST